MIVVRELTKRYGPTLALDRLSFEVRPGVVTGFLGPNGAGKSTTLRILLGLHHPTSGEALIGNSRYHRIRWPARVIGAVLDTNAAHPGRTAFDHLWCLARSNGIGRARVTAVLEHVGLAAVAHKRVGGFSLGMRQRLGIAGALLGDPAVILLDEPDPTVVIMPFVGFFVASIGAMSMTTEFTTGSIGSTLVAVPQRHVLLAAKAAVVGTVSLLGGLAFALLTFVSATLLLGSRPAPLNPWPNWTDAMPSIFSAALFVLVTGAVALGLGAVLRSTAATLVSLGGLVLVAPMFAHFLPTAWHLPVASILLTNLAPQVAGTDHPYLLSQAGAAAVMVVYVVLALGGGALSFTRRDAS